MRKISDGRIIIDTLLDTDGLEKGAKSLGGIASGGLKILSAAAIGGSVALGGLGIACTMLASDLGEVQNVVDTTFGDNASKINDWAKSAAASFGIGELQAKQFTGTMGAMLKSMGLTGDEVLNMSEGMVGLSGDMASFYNLDPQEAFEKIRSGISGETEPLKQLGINMSVANLEAFALTQGITKQYKEMNQAEQATLRYSYLMKTTADSQGDFAKTSDSLANQMRVASLNVKSLGADIGKILLPIAQDAMKSFNGIAEKLREALSNPETQESIKKLATMIGELVTGALKFLVDHLDDIIKGFTWLIDNAPLIAAGITAIATALAVMKVAGAIGFIVGIFSQLFLEIATGTPIMAALNIVLGLNPFILIAAAVAALVVGFVVLWNTSEGFRNFWIGLWDSISLKLSEFGEFLTGIFATDWSESFGMFGEYLNVLLANVGNVFDAVKQIFSGVIDFVAGVFTGDWSRAWDGVVGIFGGIMNGLGAIIKAPLNGVIGLINMAIGGLNSISVDIPDFVPGIGGKHFGLDLPKIDYLYTGGVFDKPTLLGNTVVGDKYKGSGSQREWVLPDKLLRQTMQEVVGSQLSVLFEKMSDAVNSSVAGTTANVVAQNNFSIAKENPSVDTSNSNSNNPIIVNANLIVDGKEFTQTVVAPNQGVLDSWGDGR